MKKQFAVARIPENQRYEFRSLEILQEFDLLDQAVNAIENIYLEDWLQKRVIVIRNVPLKLKVNSSGG